MNNIYRYSPYLTGNTLRLHYRAQPVNAVYCENHTEHTVTLYMDRMHGSSVLKKVVHIVTFVL
jgi:hypothetical protein